MVIFYKNMSEKERNPPLTNRILKLTDISDADILQSLDETVMSAAGLPNGTNGRKESLQQMIENIKKAQLEIRVSHVPALSFRPTDSDAVSDFDITAAFQRMFEGVTPRPVLRDFQRRAIRTILSEKDSMIIAPTGSGTIKKTLAESSEQ